MTKAVELSFFGETLRFESSDSNLIAMMGGLATGALGRRSPVKTPSLRVRLEGGPALSWRATADEAAASLPSTYPEAGAVLRAAMAHSLFPGGALFHGAGLVVDGVGVACLAPSGGGKSTLSRLCSPRVAVLSDETIGIRGRGDDFEVHGTSFWSDAPLPTAAGAFRLNGVCFLRKGRLGLTELPRAQAVRELLAQAHLPDRAGASEALLALAERLTARVPCLALSFSLTDDPLPLLRRLSDGPRPRRLCRAHGTCMWPAIREGDLLFHAPPSEEPLERQLNSVAIALSPSGELVAHRILRVFGPPGWERIVLAGDLAVEDRPRWRSQIVGLVEAIYRPGRGFVDLPPPLRPGPIGRGLLRKIAALASRS